MVPLGGAKSSKRGTLVAGSGDPEDVVVSSNAKTHQIQVLTQDEEKKKVVLKAKASRSSSARLPKIIIEKEEQKSYPTESLEYRWPFTMYYMKAYVTYDDLGTQF